MENLVGQNLDHYHITSLLFEDQSANLFLANDQKLDRLVAIYLNKQQEKQVEKYLQDARSMVTWRHAGLARLYDVGSYEGRLYFVQENISSQSLNQIQQNMRQADCWPGLAETVLLVKELCLAVSYAHQNGKIHGNIYPANILFKTDPSDNLPYQPIIIRTGMIAPGAGLSAAAYRAPEINRGASVGKAADIFSLGAVLYELVTGQPPTPQTQVSSGPPQVLPPHLLHPDLTDDLEKIILKSLSPNPEDRFGDASVLASALMQILPQFTRSQAAPSGISRTAQIISFFENSPEEQDSPIFAPRLNSADTILPSSVVDISGDTVYVLMPDKSVRNFKMKPGGLSIGRTKESDIPLDLPGISRNHARIDFDGQNYLIRDLNSLNGTFIEQKRINADKPLIWLPGENLRIGEAWLRVERQAQGRTTQAVIAKDLPTNPNRLLPETDEVFVSQNGNPLDSAQVIRSAGLGWLGVYSDSLNISVTPGSSIDLPILLFNRGPANDNIQISLQGIPLEWAPGIPSLTRVPSNNQKEIRLAIRPPRSPQVRAGRYMLVIRIASQNSPDQVVELRPTLTVTAFSLFASELRPDTIQTGDIGQVYIHNRGNLPETYTVIWEERAHTLVFDPPKVKVNLQVGKSAVVEFRPSLLRPRLTGPENSHSFQTHVSSQGGQTEVHQGEYISRGVLPTWAPIALAALALMLACGICLMINQITIPVRKADRTTNAGNTEVAVATQTAVFYKTATSESLEGANQATLQAATATAAWLSTDEDQDGLTNNLEIIAGTLPNVSDTDADGLNDGLEIRTWNTNPIVADTDSDGLKDGVEVERGTNPLLRDTDGDGLEDSIDPDPLNIPTRTPYIYLPTATRRPKLTPTPTFTNTPTHTPTPRFTDLTVEISNGQSSSIPGTNTIYSVLVTNRGPAVSNSTQIIDQFPSTLTNVTWICNASPGSRCLTTNGSGNINALIDLAVGGTATLTINTRIAPNAVGLLTNTVRVSPQANLAELNPTDNQATDTDNLTPRAALSLSKTDNKDVVQPGQTLAYTIIVFNNGPSSVNNINVLDSIPAKLTNVTWTCSATAGSSCSASGTQSGNINALVNLNPSGTATFNINATVRNNESGTISNTASIISPIDPGTNNKSATDTTAIESNADLMLTVAAPITITSSSKFTYTVTITNSGPSSASGIIMTDTLTNTVKFLSVEPGSPKCQEEDHIIQCILGTLASGEAIQIKILVGAPSVLGDFKNIVEIKAEQPDPDLLNNKITTTIKVE